MLSWPGDDTLRAGGVTRHQADTPWLSHAHRDEGGGLGDRQSAVDSTIFSLINQTGEVNQAHKCGAHTALNAVCAPHTCPVTLTTPCGDARGRVARKRAFEGFVMVL